MQVRKNVELNAASISVETDPVRQRAIVGRLLAAAQVYHEFAAVPDASLILKAAAASAERSDIVSTSTSTDSTNTNTTTSKPLLRKTFDDTACDWRRRAYEAARQLKLDPQGLCLFICLNFLFLTLFYLFYFIVVLCLIACVFRVCSDQTTAEPMVRVFPRLWRE